MSSDYNPIAAIKGKLTIMHIDHIKDLEKYKKQDDFYDRYTKRRYDVIPIEKAANLPVKVQSHIRNYKYLLVEQGKGKTFLFKRICPSCDGWCNIGESVVQCEGCSDTYHTDCVGLERKRPKQKPVTGNVKKLRKTVSADAINMEAANLEENTDQELPEFPFYYFGEYSNSADLLTNDVMRGYPKAHSRLGKEHQADATPFDPTAKDELAEEGTVDRYNTDECVFYLPDDCDLDVFLEECKTILDVEKLDSTAVDALTQCLHEFHCNKENTFNHIKTHPQDFSCLPTWSSADQAAMDAGIVKYNQDLYWIQKEFLNHKTLKDVILYYYMFKEDYTDKYKQNDDSEKENSPALKEMDIDTSDEEAVHESDEEELECTNCFTKNSANFRKPLPVGAIMHCDSCRKYWLKYGTKKPLSEHERKPSREACYGVSHKDLEGSGQYRCDVCVFKAKTDPQLIPQCVLCTLEIDARFSPLKKTIGTDWAHSQCAIWIPQIKFGNPTTLEYIECIGLIDQVNWVQVCSICKQRGGATIRCSERVCNSYFHVTCSQMRLSTNHLFVRIIKNKVEVGGYCSQHSRKSAKTTTVVPQLISELIEHKCSPPLLGRGQKRAYSQGLLDHCDCHLKKSKHLDELESDKACSICKITQSPLWFQADNLFQCLTCNNKKFICQMEICGFAKIEAKKSTILEVEIKDSWERDIKPGSQASVDSMDFILNSFNFTFVSVGLDGNHLACATAYKFSIYTRNGNKFQLTGEGIAAEKETITCILCTALYMPNNKEQQSAIASIAFKAMACEDDIEELVIYYSGIYELMLTIFAVFSYAKSLLNIGAAEDNPSTNFRPTQLNAQCTIEDGNRSAVRISVQPGGGYCAVSDNLGRVLLYDTSDATIVSIWKGIRDAQLGWIQISNETDPTIVSQLLVIYGNTGILEIHSIPDCARICAMNVGKGLKLVHTPASIIGGMHWKGEPNRFNSQCYLLATSGDLKSINITVELKHPNEFKDLKRLINGLTDQNIRESTETIVNYLSNLHSMSIKLKALELFSDSFPFQAFKNILLPVTEYIPNILENPNVEYNFVELNMIKYLHFFKLYESMAVDVDQKDSYPQWINEMISNEYKTTNPQSQIGYLTFIRSFSVNPAWSERANDSKIAPFTIGAKESSVADLAGFLLDRIRPNNLSSILDGLRMDVYDLCVFLVRYLDEYISFDGISVHTKNNFLLISSYYLLNSDQQSQVADLMKQVYNPVLAYWIALAIKNSSSHPSEEAVKVLEHAPQCIQIYKYLQGNCRVKLLDFLKKETCSFNYLVAKYIQISSVDDFEEFIAKTAIDINISLSSDIIVAYLIWFEFGNWKSTNQVDCLDKILMYYVKIQDSELQYCIACVFQAGIKDQLHDHIEMIEKLHGKPKEPVNKRFAKFSVTTSIRLIDICIEILKPLQQCQTILHPIDISQKLTEKTESAYFDSFFGDLTMMLPNELAVSCNSVVDYISMLHVLKFTYSNELQLVHPKRYFTNLKQFESCICETVLNEKQSDR
ncbi:putative PHD type zinc finger protein with BAH domain-containing protein [Terramyces sp. JEL0728]|nr:putative PHD type zinc finger protein with BAH domain-containing protein [Terramyces sp. JEL0728]